MAVNRLLSICTSLLIQELVCTVDGTPFTMLIKAAAAAAARSRREMVGKEEEEDRKENEREVGEVGEGRAGMDGLSS